MMETGNSFRQEENMKFYRIILVILLVVAVGCGAWYFYGVLKGDNAVTDGTLVKKCEEMCRSFAS
jgi:membrane protein DedA with SNARE-associated domain